MRNIKILETYLEVYCVYGMLFDYKGKGDSWELRLLN